MHIVVNVMLTERSLKLRNRRRKYKILKRVIFCINKSLLTVYLIVSGRNITKHVKMTCFRPSLWMPKIYRYAFNKINAYT